jgi:hypothetical protein
MRTALPIKEQEDYDREDRDDHNTETGHLQ